MHHPLTNRGFTHESTDEVVINKRNAERDGEQVEEVVIACDDDQDLQQ